MLSGEHDIVPPPFQFELKFILDLAGVRVFLQVTILSSEVTMLNIYYHFHSSSAVASSMNVYCRSSKFKLV